MPEAVMLTLVGGLMGFAGGIITTVIAHLLSVAYERRKAKQEADLKQEAETYLLRIERLESKQSLWFPDSDSVPPRLLGLLRSLFSSFDLTLNMVSLIIFCISSLLSVMAFFYPPPLGWDGGSLSFIFFTLTCGVGFRIVIHRYFLRIIQRYRKIQTS